MDIKNAWRVAQSKDHLNDHLLAMYEQDAQVTIDTNHTRILVPLFLEFLSNPSGLGLKEALKKPATIDTLLQAKGIAGTLRDELMFVKFNRNKVLNDRLKIFTNILDSLAEQGFLIKLDNTYMLNDENCLLAQTKQLINRSGKSAALVYLGKLASTKAPAEIIARIRQQLFPQIIPQKKAIPSTISEARKTVPSSSSGHAVFMPEAAAYDIPASAIRKQVTPETPQKMSARERLVVLYDGTHSLEYRQKELTELIASVREETPSNPDQKHAWLAAFFNDWGNVFLAHYQARLLNTTPEKIKEEQQFIQETGNAALKLDPYRAAGFVDLLLKQLHVLAQTLQARAITQKFSDRESFNLVAFQVLATRNKLHQDAAKQFSRTDPTGSLLNERR